MKDALSPVSDGVLGALDDAAAALGVVVNRVVLLVLGTVA